MAHDLALIILSIGLALSAIPIIANIVNHGTLASESIHPLLIIIGLIPLTIILTRSAVTSLLMAEWWWVRRHVREDVRRADIPPAPVTKRSPFVQYMERLEREAVARESYRLEHIKWQQSQDISIYDISPFIGAGILLDADAWSFALDLRGVSRD